MENEISERELDVLVRCMAGNHPKCDQPYRAKLTRKLWRAQQAGGLVSVRSYRNEVRLAFVTGFSTARPVLEPPHQHTDEDVALMRRAFPFNFPLED